MKKCNIILSRTEVVDSTKEHLPPFYSGVNGKVYYDLPPNIKYDGIRAFNGAMIVDGNVMITDTMKRIVKSLVEENIPYDIYTTKLNTRLMENLSDNARITTNEVVEYKAKQLSTIILPTTKEHMHINPCDVNYRVIVDEQIPNINELLTYDYLLFNDKNYTIVEVINTLLNTDIKRNLGNLVVTLLLYYTTIASTDK